MVKRGIIQVYFLIFSVILLISSLTAQASLFSGTVEDNDVMNISGSIFEFRIDPNTRKVYVEIDISGLIISPGDCEVKDQFEICVNLVNFSYRNYTTYNDVYKADIEVDFITSDLEITHTIVNDKLLIDEEETVELSLENEEEISAENVTAIISIPPHIRVIDTDGCKKTSDSIVFTGSVSSTQTRKCTYTIAGTSGGDFELTANISFFNGAETKTKISDSIDGKIYNYSLTVSTQTENKSIDIQEVFNLTVSLQNINDLNDLIVTNFNLRIPEELRLVKKPLDISGSNRVLTWSGLMTPGENKSFSFELSAERSGNQSITYDATYKIQKFTRKFNDKTKIEIHCYCPFISHMFSEEITKTSKSSNMRAFLINPSKTQQFKNVNVKYTTNIPTLQDYSKSHSAINPSDSIKLFDSVVSVPNLDGNYFFDISAVYESKSGQIFTAGDKILFGAKETEQISDKEQKETQPGEGYKNQSETVGSSSSKEETSSAADNQTDKDEIPVTIIENDEKRSFKTLTILGYAGLFVILLLIIFIYEKKKRDQERENEFTKMINDE